MQKQLNGINLIVWNLNQQRKHSIILRAPHLIVNGHGETFNKCVSSNIALQF